MSDSDRIHKELIAQPIEEYLLLIYIYIYIYIYIVQPLWVYGYLVGEELLLCCYVSSMCWPRLHGKENTHTPLMQQWYDQEAAEETECFKRTESKSSRQVRAAHRHPRHRPAVGVTRAQ